VDSGKLILRQANGDLRPGHTKIMPLVGPVNELSSRLTGRRQIPGLIAGRPGQPQCGGGTLEMAGGRRVKSQPGLKIPRNKNFPASL
jgi:hypothetical protein